MLVRTAEIDDDSGSEDLEEGFDEFDDGLHLEFLLDIFDRIELFDVGFEDLRGPCGADDEEGDEAADDCDDADDGQGDDEYELNELLEVIGGGCDGISERGDSQQPHHIAAEFIEEEA